jgi:branched-chain amino acid transport system substrate-binding protein
MISSRRQFLRTTAAAAAAISIKPAFAKSQEPLLIGVPLPLTGVLAGGGQVILSGIKYAADVANKSGGVLGHPIKLVIEDTKSEANTAATIAAKMATEDKVYAFVGGYGSTPDFALLSSVRRYSPLFIHTGSSSVRLETTFGKENWYYHVYIWDYHRQKAAARFFASIRPKVKTVALAYEDGLYGADAAKYAEQYLKAEGLELIMKEPFKTGSPDFSPILTRVKSLNPDAFFSVGYSGDNLQLVRQEKSLGVRPKLTMVVSAGDKRADYGNTSEGTTMIAEWSAYETTPGVAEFVKKAQSATGQTIISPFVQAYVGLKTLIDSIAAARTTDLPAVQQKLSSLTFDTPYGKIGYKGSNAAKHQLLSDETMVVTQHRKMGEEVVFPPGKAGGKLIYPVQ